MTAVDARQWMLAELDRPDPVDALLIAVYLAGIYLGISAGLPGGVPIPAVLAGAAGLLLAAKHAPKLPTPHAAAGVAVLVVGALSTLAAGDFALLTERFKGFVQFAYSLVIAYGLFLAGRRFDRGTLAGLFLAASLAILAGALLETSVPAFKQLSDGFRRAVFESGVYGSDTRDLALYGMVRPKLFTSEPSFLAFGYTLFAFCWYVLARARGKMLAYLALLAAGYLLMRGPALVLGVALVPIYEVLLGARRERGGRRRLDGSHAAIAAATAGFIALAGGVAGWEALAPRIENIAAGRDPSFFARIVAPAAIAIQTIQAHPIAGVGLSGWEALTRPVAQLYATSGLLAYDVTFDGPSRALTNYFWELWIFLGLVWGTAMILALSWLLRRLEAPSLLFCWGVWIVFGQAVGSFVGPRTWTVLFLAALVSVLHEQGSRRRDRPPAARGFDRRDPRLDPRVDPRAAPSAPSLGRAPDARREPRLAPQ